MRRLQLNLQNGSSEEHNCTIARVRAHQEGFTLKGATLREIALKKCTRLAFEMGGLGKSDSFIFTEL